ncbi:MAG: VOC family protein [Kineosporiaceae bacterium]
MTDNDMTDDVRDDGTGRTASDGTVGDGLAGDGAAGDGAAFREAANGEHTVNGIPRSVTSLTPFLVIPDARGAITFYRDVFGARVVDVTEMSGAVAHAVLDFGNGQLQLGEPLPAYGLVAAPEGDEDCYSMGLYRPDVDATLARAKAAGATVREPATTFVSGDRFASIRDPFGVRWSIMTRVEDLSEEESARRVAEWAAQQS